VNAPFIVWLTGLPVSGMTTMVNAGHQYAFSLLLAILIASTSNFILNKKWTFKK
jgi:putative flippase GtrA